MEILLEVKNVVRHYDGVKALQDVSLQVYKNEILGLIGPNGAGKTTLFNLITGMDQLISGGIYLDTDKALHSQNPYQIARLGVARTFQNIRLFKDLTVMENILLGAHYQNGIRKKSSGLYRAMRSLLRHQEIENEQLEICTHWLKFFNLEPYQNELAVSLPYGKQRELEIARALAGNPCLLFLDEPAAGMNPSETQELMKNIERISNLGITLVLIEHDMRLVMEICQRIVVLHQGHQIAEGSPQAIRKNPMVIEAYLGSTAQELSC